MVTVNGHDYELDLGCDHYLNFIRWAPDDLPANRELYGFPLPVIERAGATVLHRDPKSETGWCEGFIQFDHPEMKLDRPRWKVESLDPLTLSPSILCSCGDHGFICEGRWVSA